VTGSAVLSECGRYRYRLTRWWSDDGGQVVFIMLNPSTATSEDDDPTIRKCIGFAQRWGHGCLAVLNLYALRSTDPKGLQRVADPKGPDNDGFIERSLILAKESGDKVVVAWGNDPFARRRALTIGAMARKIGVPLICLRKNKNGSPMHPLYVPYEAEPQPWSAP